MGNANPCEQVVVISGTVDLDDATRSRDSMRMCLLLSLLSILSSGNLGLRVLYPMLVSIFPYRCQPHPDSMYTQRVHRHVLLIEGVSVLHLRTVLIPADRRGYVWMQRWSRG